MTEVRTEDKELLVKFSENHQNANRERAKKEQEEREAQAARYKRELEEREREIQSKVNFLKKQIFDGVLFPKVVIPRGYAGDLMAEEIVKYFPQFEIYWDKNPVKEGEPEIIGGYSYRTWVDDPGTSPWLKITGKKRVKG